MEKKYKFRSLKVRKKDAFQNCPDWDNVIKINNTYFSFTGWMNVMTSDIDWVLEAVTEDRLSKDKYLKTAYVEALSKFKNK